MKIVHTMPDIDKEASGPSYSVVRLCESLRTSGCSVELAVIGSQDQNSSIIHTFPPGFGPKRLGLSPSMNRWIRRQVTSREVDIIHNHSLWMMPNVYPGLAARGTNIPYIVSPRGTMSEWAMNSGSKAKKIFWPLLQKPSIKNASLFHATAVSELEEIRRLGFRQPVAIIPNGIDLPKFGDAKKSSGRILLFISRIHPKKGIEFLIDSWRLLQNEFPDWTLKIVGPGEHEYTDALKSRASGLSRIEFTGPLYGQDKVNAYQAADLYVLPTFSENFGMTVAEAMACGTPVVVSQGAPWCEVVRRDAGWWPEIGMDPLLACLRQAMTMPRNVLEAMGENGKSWMSQEYAWSGIAASMHDVYSWLLGQGDMPSCVVKE